MFSIKSALPLPKSEFLDTLLEFIPGISDAFVINQIVRCHSHNWNAFNSTLWRTEAFIFRRVHWNWILCIVDYTQRTQTVVDCLLLAARLKCCNVTCIAHTTNLCLFLSAHLFTSIDSWGSIICFWHWRMYLLCVCVCSSLNSAFRFPNRNFDARFIFFSLFLLLWMRQQQWDHIRYFPWIAMHDIVVTISLSFFSLCYIFSRSRLLFSFTPSSAILCKRWIFSFFLCD